MVIHKKSFGVNRFWVRGNFGEVTGLKYGVALKYNACLKYLQS